MAANDFIVRDDECSELGGYLALWSSRLKINLSKRQALETLSADRFLWPLGFEEARGWWGEKNPLENVRGHSGGLGWLIS